jgi:hypothetical protein
VPLVAVIRTVVAVTAPFVAAGPKALTQSPTARSVDAAVWVEPTVVELDVVIFSVSVLVFGTVGFFVLFEVDLLEGRANCPALMVIPDTVRVEPLTPVTLPDAIARLANSLRKLDDPLPLKLGRVPPSGAAPPGPPLPNRKAPPAPAPAPPDALRVPTPVHEPDEVAVLTVIERAAMVVLELLDCVPLTVTQSPLASALTDSVTDLENEVDGVQFTVVCPELWLWTSMLDPLSAATLPVAPVGALAGVAAPAAVATAVAASRAVAPVPAIRMKCRRLLLRLVSDCIVLIPLSLSSFVL